MFRYINPHLTILIISFLYSCSSNERVEKLHEDNVTNHQTEELKAPSNNKIQISLAECTKNAVYYLDEVDITTYDSVTTQYFHEVLDYTLDEAIQLEKETELLKQYINKTDFQKQTGNESDSIIDLYYRNKNALSKYKKEVTGYVYVHTFINNTDTLSALILANANCTKATAIKVRTISDIDPSMYASQIRKINK